MDQRLAVKSDTDVQQTEELSAVGPSPMPVLAIGGTKGTDQCPWVHNRPNAPRMSNAALLGAGHWATGECPEEVVNLVVDFLH